MNNGSWSGMVGLLNRNEADLGIGNLFLTLFRKEAVDYSAPYDAEVRNVDYIYLDSIFVANVQLT